MVYRLIAIALLLTACTNDDPPNPVIDHARISDWHVSVELPDAVLPVKLQLSPDGSEAWFENGREVVRVPQLGKDGQSWTLRFPTFNNTMVLNQTATGFSGSLTLVKQGYEQVMPLVAVPDKGFRFTQNGVPEIDVTGRWEVKFTEDDGTRYVAVGEFDQQGEKLTGTFLTAKGDYRYLAGEVDGQTLNLSTFDGAHAFVFTAEGQTDGSLKGHFWSGTKWHETWEAERNFDASLPDAYSLTYLKEGYDRMEFSFPGLDGVQVSLDDVQFKDKVVLVNLSGTWCPNCADEMEFLSGVYKQQNNRGLEVITLLYEHFKEFEVAAKQGRALVEKHDIDFNVLVAGFSDKTAAAETLPMLNHVLAYPTLIFIDRLGNVRRIHTGFSGPGTGQHYEDFKIEFARNLEELLAEPVKSAEQGP